MEDYLCVLNDYLQKEKSNFEWKISNYFNGNYKDCNDLIEHAVYTHDPKLKQIHKNYRKNPREELIFNLLCDIRVFERITDFKELILWVYKNKPFGISKLGLYDTSFLLGLHKGINPDNVYLGIGSNIGAKNLFGKTFKHVVKSIDNVIEFIPKEAFPSEWQVLETYHIENLLCNYRLQLKPTS